MADSRLLRSAGIRAKHMEVATFLHGNRLEVLADRLVDEELQQLDADPLCRQVIVVGHPALGRWLQERIAGRLGIAANIDFPLPSSFAWEVLRASLGDLPADSAFSREALTWRIHAALPKWIGDPRFAPVRRYLGDGSDARKQYELAGQLARTFDEYMVNRPHWVRAWAQGGRAVSDPDEDWQAELWRHLVAGTTEQDRASLMARALERLRDPAPLPAGVPRRVAVFGASFLSPLLLEFYLALAGRLPMRFYQPNPCLDYWGDIVSLREQARLKGLWKAHQRSGRSGHAEAGHPLLASWGRLGREYLKAIHEPDVVVHDDDGFVVPDSSSLLGWLQKGLLLLDPEHAPPPRERMPSIELHGCPDRRREVEVLRDRLLAMFEQRPDLQPHDILVMSPQIDACVPYIDAVFGGADETLAIPYRISDVPLRSVHPLIDAFLRVLALGDSRFTTGDVLGLLAEPAIARRFGIDGTGHAWIASWLDQAAIRWGLDAPFRAAVGAAQVDANSWRFGFDRLLLGHALGDESGLVADVAPVANVEGADARALGELARFVDALAQTRAGYAVPRTAASWRDWLTARLELLFDSEPDDAAELAAVRSLQAAIRTFGAQADAWLEGERLPFEVVRAALEGALADPSARRGGRFGITFCGMVPMRNLPHRVVCLLGLDAGAYPRRQPVAGFNLMRRHPRPGDRSVREDDRFLFLEALVAAREVFYLSHVDRDVRSGSASPPSPLVDELFDFLAAAHGDGWNEVAATLRFHHRLHPFDPAYFSAGAAVRSYDAAWRAAAEALVAPWQRPKPFAADAEAMLAPDDVGTTIELEDLLAWLRDPLDDWFRHTLPMRVQADEAIGDSEPFVLDRLQRYRIGDRLLGALERRPDRHRLQREGVLPLGPAGEAQWEEIADCAAQIEAATAGWLGPALRTPEPARREVAIGSSGLRLSGIPRLLVDGSKRALLLRRTGHIRGIDLARLALERILLGAERTGVAVRAIGFSGRALESFELGAIETEGKWLAALANAFVEGRRWPLPLYPRSASAWARVQVKAGRKHPDTAAREAWIGNDAGAGEREAPLTALFTRDGDEPVPGVEFSRLAAAVYAPLYAAAKEIAA